MATKSFREELDIDLQKYWLAIRRQWLPAVGVFGVVTALTAIAATSIKPNYMAEGKVLIKVDNTPSLTGLDTPAAPGRNSNSIGRPDVIGVRSDPITTEVETITSLPIASGTIASLNLKGDDGRPLSPVAFLQNLEVRPIPGTDMIQVAYTDSDSKLAAAVVNQVIALYRKNNILIKQTEAISARDFIAKQLPINESAVRKAEADLRRFKEQNQVIALEEESRETVRAIGQLEDEVATARADLATASARSRELQNRLGLSPDQAVSVTALSQSPEIQAIATQIREVQGQLDVARSRYRPTHPTVVTLERQEATLLSRLQGNIQSIVGSNYNLAARGLQMGALEQTLTSNLVEAEASRVSLFNRVNELANMRAFKQQRSSVFPRLEATQRELERRLTAAQTTYELLLRRLQEVQAGEDQKIDNIRVVSPALVPEKSSSRKLLLVLLGGLSLATLLSLMTAFALDLGDRKLKSIREAQRILKLPVLGVIPQSSSLSLQRIGGGQQGQLRSGELTQAAYLNHAYQTLQANLRFLSSSVEPKTVVVTSSISGEGKTQVTANLALAIAQAGTKVLLVDADLRQPMQHQIWNCDNSVGFAQLLQQTSDLEKAVQSVFPNLFVLPAGKVTPDALAMLNPQVLHSFIEVVSAQYDMVIFDTPPLSAAADASILGKVVDGSLIVVRPEYVEVNDVKATKGLIDLSGDKPLGIVANCVKSSTKPNKYLSYSDELARFNPGIQVFAPASSSPQLKAATNGKVIAPIETNLIEK